MMNTKLEKISAISFTEQRNRTLRVRFPLSRRTLCAVVFDGSIVPLSLAATFNCRRERSAVQLLAMI